MAPGMGLRGGRPPHFFRVRSSESAAARSAMQQKWRNVVLGNGAQELTKRCANPDREGRDYFLALLSSRSVW